MDPYYPAGTLALRPVSGFPLADGETYCALLTQGVRDPTGRYLRSWPAFAAALDSESWLAPLKAWLPNSQLRSQDLAVATCFTVGQSAAPLARIRDALQARPAPDAAELHHADTAAQLADKILAEKVI